jgi:hypothetical protein
MDHEHLGFKHVCEMGAKTAEHGPKEHGQKAVSISGRKEGIY